MSDHYATLKKVANLSNLSNLSIPLPVKNPLMFNILG